MTTLTITRLAGGTSTHRTRCLLPKRWLRSDALRTPEVRACLLARMSPPAVWTGRALQGENDDLEKVGLAFLYPAHLRPRMVRSPVDICLGTRPSQAEKSPALSRMPRHCRSRQTAHQADYRDKGSRPWLVAGGEADDRELGRAAWLDETADQSRKHVKILLANSRSRPHMAPSRHFAAL
jgi:hypothetical protein